jgi:chromatin remodeling complex protein RSC6
MSTPVKISDELATFMEMKSGERISPQEIFKYVYDYIIKHDLLDKNDKNIIVCDQKLKNLFKYDPPISWFQKNGKPETFSHCTLASFLKGQFIKEEPRKVSGFNRPVKISQEIAEFLELDPNKKFLRRDIAKYIGFYIRKHDLYDGRTITCDEKLQKLLKYEAPKPGEGGIFKRLTFFTLHRYLKPHFIPDKISEEKECDQDKKTENPTIVSAFDRPVKISQELAEFLELDPNEKFSRRDIIKYIYNYIKKHNLAEKEDKHVIICDDKLKKLLKCSTILIRSQIPTYLKPHFLSSNIEMEPETSEQDNTINPPLTSQGARGNEVPPLGILRLRRCFACMPNSVEQEMKLVFFDMKSSSNSDISATTECFRRQVYRHPRARQLAAACRYGWMVTPTEGYIPEEFMSRLSSATLRFEEKARTFTEKRDI